MGTATLGYPGGPSVAFRIGKNIIFGKIRCMTAIETCTIPGCKKFQKCRKLCGMHYERQRKHGDASVVLKAGTKPGKTRELSSQWKGDAAGLDAQHKRVSAVRGTPAQCEHCGTTDPGQYYHWAFNNTGDRFSIWDYIRLCVTCHRKYDDAYCPRGSRHGMAKLTEEDIPKIFAMRSEKKVLREIAETFDVTIQAVHDVLSGKTWGHLNLNGGGA